MDAAHEIDTFLESDCPYRDGIWRGFLISRLTAYHDHRDIMCEKRSSRAEIAARFASDAHLPIHDNIMKAFNASNISCLCCDDRESYHRLLREVFDQLLET